MVNAQVSPVLSVPVGPERENFSSDAPVVKPDAITVTDYKELLDHPLAIISKPVSKEAPSVQLVASDLAPKTPGVVPASLTDHMAEQLAKVNKITAALASMPTTVFGGALGGAQAGWMHTVEQTQLGLTGIRNVTEWQRTVGEWTTLLYNQQAALDLITQLRRFDVIPAETKPEDALAIASTFVEKVQNLRLMNTGKELQLAKVEQEVLKVELTSMRLQAKSAGELIIAPFTGAAVELFGRMPVEVLAEFAPGMVRVLKETLKEGAAIPGEVTAALVVGPFQGIAKGMKQIVENDLTVEGAVGTAVWAVPTIVEGGLLLTGNLIPAADLLAKAATLGISSFLFMGLGVAVGTMVGVVRRGDNFHPHQAFQAREEAKSQVKEEKEKPAEKEETIEGKFKVVSDKNS